MYLMFYQEYSKLFFLLSWIFSFFAVILTPFVGKVQKEYQKRSLRQQAVGETFGGSVFSESFLPVSIPVIPLFVVEEIWEKMSQILSILCLK